MNDIESVGSTSQQQVSAPSQVAANTAPTPSLEALDRTIRSMSDVTFALASMVSMTDQALSERLQDAIGDIDALTDQLRRWKRAERLPSAERVESEAVASLLRGLLRVSSPRGAVDLLHETIRGMGGDIVPVAAASDDALPIDVSLGEGPPMLVDVEVMTVARIQLERLLPPLVEDTRQAVHLLRRTDRHQDEAIRDSTTDLGNRRIPFLGAATLQYRLDDVVAPVSELGSGEQLEGHRRELAALRSLSRTLLSSKSTEEVLRELTRLLRDLLDADLAISVGPSSGGDLQVLFADGLVAEQVHGASIPSDVSAISPSQPPLGSVHVGDVSDLHPDHPLTRAKLFGPLLSVALHSSGWLLGKLTVARRAGARPFDADDTARAHSFAQQAGIAFRQRADRLHSERVAHQLRQALQPPELPTVLGAEVAALYLPADGDLSGDFYDVWPLAGGAWSLACGDVEGHGPEAAILTSLARNTLHTAALTTDDPITVLHLLNTTFRTTTERFCSCIFAHLRPTLSTMEVTFARGGHPYPIVVRADGTVRPVEVSGTLLGVFTRPSLELATITLGAGDSLVLYTDGLIEVRNHANEQFGEHRVAEVLGAGPRRTATELVNDLHRAVGAHAATLNDDLTVLALTATGSVEISGSAKASTTAW